MAKVKHYSGPYLAQLVFGIISSVVTIVNVPIWRLSSFFSSVTMTNSFGHIRIFGF